MRSFSFLHLTDLHIGNPPQEWLWPTVKEEFYSDLEKIYEPSGPWDFVIFTGDLTQSGKREQFSELNFTLEQLWKHFKSLGCEPLLIPIPGNHDLELSDSKDHNPALIALAHWFEDERIRNSFWGSQTNEYFTEVERSFNNYTLWLTELKVPVPDNINKGHLPGDCSLIIEKNGLRIGIVGVNTSFLQLSKGEFAGKLDMNEMQVHKVCDGNAGHWCKGVDLSFLITHHSPEYLHTSTQHMFRSEIYPPGRFFAHICGHLHEPPAMKSLSEEGSDIRRFWQGPSLFGLKVWGPNNQERVHGYTAYRFEIEDSNGVAQIWPRKMVKAYAGHYRIGPDQGYQLEESNSLVIRFSIKSQEVITATSKVDVSFVADSKENIRIPLLIIDKEISSEIAKEQLQLVPKFRLRSEPQHMAIRIENQNLMTSFIEKDKCAWLISDWGLGKNGFLGSTVDRIRGLNTNENIYRLNCDVADTVEQIILLTNEQFGIPLQAFCAYLSRLPSSILILDDISPEIYNGSPNIVDRFNELISSLIDYCPNLYLILTARRPPKRSDYKYVELTPLDLPETRIYLHGHPETQAGLEDTDTIETLFMRSGGLPMHLDRMLKALKISTLEELLDVELEAPLDDLEKTEPVPKALKKVIASLSQSKDRHQLRSYRLLKVLSVLSNGESMSSIKRFYPTEPFYPENAYEIESLSLLEISELPTLIQ